MTLRGGDEKKGKQETFESRAQCTLCHSFGKEGPNIGPDLGHISAKLSREQLLQALVAPSVCIAPGCGPAPSGMPRP